MEHKWNNALIDDTIHIRRMNPEDNLLQVKGTGTPLNIFSITSGNIYRYMPYNNLKKLYIS